MTTGSRQGPNDDPSAARLSVESATLLNVIQDAVIVTDPTLRITGWNPAAEALYGWPATEALGQLAHDLLRTDYLGKQRPQLLQELQDQGVWRGEVVHHHRDGHPIAVLATVTWLRGPAGEPLGALSVNRDISERRRAEQAMRTSEAKLRAVFNALVEGVVFLNPQGEVEEANDAIQRFHGHTLEELADPETDPRRKIVRADGSPFPEGEQPAMVALRTNQPVRDVEMGVPAGDGSFRWRIVNAQPVNDSDGTLLGAVASFFDISERKRAEQALQRSTERLEILAEASRVFAEAGSEYDTVLSRVARTLVALMGDGCIIALISDDGAWLQTSHVYDVDPEVQELTRSLIGGRRRIEESTTNARVFQTGQPLLVPLVDRDQLRAAAKPEYAVMIERQACHSLIVVPMRASGRVISVLTLYRRQPERPAFDTYDLSLVQDLADRAALAIGNAQLLVRVQAELAERQRAQKVTELLYLASQLLARPLGHDEVLNTLLDVLQQLIPYDSANIMLPDGPDAFRVRYLRGYETWTDPAAVEALSFDPAQRPLLAQIIATRRSLLIADTQQDPGWEPMMGAGYIGCWLGVPLIANNTLFGIFSIDRHQPHSLSAGDVQLAETLAVSAAMAIERAQLLAELRDERAQLARRVAERTADLSLANAELARAARLKDEFLASMSHELRTPLTGILGRAEALEEAIYGSVTAEQVSALRSIAESGQHLLTLINDILDLSKIESGRMDLERVTLDVDLLGTMSIRMVAQIAQLKRIALSSRFDGQVQWVEADERRLKQILVNLLSNAVKFTPEGGKVGLEVQGDPEQQTVTFTVWDTGIGIAAEDLPKLFQPFVQLDSSLNRQYTGSGLGLSLVARLAQAHGGSVSVESTPGQGSRFSVTLPWKPVMLAAAPAQASVAVDTTRPALRKALVVEDSPTAASQLTRYLRELGARVEIHPHATGTVERAIELQPDVIILDILLPDDDGWAVLRQLKAEPRTRDIPILVTSVVDEPARAHQLGAAAMLLKPLDRPRLEQALRKILARPDASPPATALVVAPQLGRPRILIADDNEETLDTIGDYLRAKGYELRVARNGREAIVQAQEEQPDVILMDIQMPGMDGLEAMQRIRAEAALAHVPILAVTALAMPGDRERCLAAGADAYLPKPLNLRMLVTTIEAHRQRRAGPASGGQGEPPARP